MNICGKFNKILYMRRSNLLRTKYAMYLKIRYISYKMVQQR